MVAAEAEIIIQRYGLTLSYLSNLESYISLHIAGLFIYLTLDLTTGDLLPSLLVKEGVRMPDDIALKTAEKYQEAWEKITGGKI
jgi:hypothetical protein